MKPSPTAGMTRGRAERERRIARAIQGGKKPGLVARMEGITPAEAVAIAEKFKPAKRAS